MRSLWQFVACAAVLSLLVPFCGIPALVFAIRSQSSYRHGDVATSRAQNLIALQLITAAGVYLCALAVTACVLIAVFSYGDVVSPTSSGAVKAAPVDSLRRPKGLTLSSTAFEKALQRHAVEALDKPTSTHNRARPLPGLGAMISKTKLLEDRSSSTRKPTTESGFLQRLRTWKGSSAIN